MLKQKYITREQKMQINRFLQQIYGFPFKAGGAYLCGAGFENKSCIHRSIRCKNRRFAGFSIRELSTFLRAGRAIAEGQRNICGGSITSSSTSTFSRIFLRTTKL